jgi:hypothetical protein
MRLTVLCVFLCLSPVRLHAQSADRRPMNDADFKILISQTEELLTVFGNELNGIDLDKNPSISYSTGKWIADKKAIALLEIGNIRIVIAKLQGKRTVHDEFALKEFLSSLFDAGEEIVWQEDFAHLSLTHLEKHAPELGAILGRISNDVNARILLLEIDPCHK